MRLGVAVTEGKRRGCMVFVVAGSTPEARG